MKALTEAECWNLAREVREPETAAMWAIAAGIQGLLTELRGNDKRQGFVEYLGVVLDTASHNHAQRMR